MRCSRSGNDAQVPLRLDDYQEPSKRTVEYAIECVLGAEGMLAHLDRPSLNKERFVHVGLVLCKIILRACELPLPGGEGVPRKGGGDGSLAHR